MTASRPGADSDYTERRGKLLASARKGDDHAFKELRELLTEHPDDAWLYRDIALCYYKRSGHRPENQNLVITNLQRAAELGNALAMFDLYSLYDQGLCVKQDEAMALEWLLKSALAHPKPDGYAYKELVSLTSNGKAEYEMGTLLFNTSVNYTEAVKFFRRASDKGDERAICSLGQAYEGGEGVEFDLKKAARYYFEAASKKGTREEGSVLALERLQKVIAKMPPDLEVLSKLPQLDSELARGIYEEQLSRLFEEIAAREPVLQDIAEKIKSLREIAKLLFALDLEVLTVEREALNRQSSRTPEQENQLKVLILLSSNLYKILNFPGALGEMKDNMQLFADLSKIERAEAKHLREFLLHEKTIAYFAEQLRSCLVALAIAVENKKWGKWVPILGYLSKDTTGAAELKQSLKNLAQKDQIALLLVLAEVTKTVAVRINDGKSRHDSVFYSNLASVLQKINLYFKYADLSSEISELDKEEVPLLRQAAAMTTFPPASQNTLHEAAEALNEAPPTVPKQSHPGS